MTQKKHHNHFVPQMYLKNWSDHRSYIWSYRLLVPTAQYPVWKYQPIGKVASKRDLYTVVEDGQDDDSFERWIDSEFEAPARDALSKVVNDKKLSPTDWKRLALFFAAQDVRTPLNYLESSERWAKTLPQLLEKVLKDSLRVLDEHYRDGKPLPERDLKPQFFGDVVDVSVIRNTVPEKNLGEIHAQIVAGRKLWIESHRNLLTNTSKALLQHKWSIVEPAGGMSWFTSDQPTMRLNYYKDGAYDFKGGWGKDGGYLIMPISSTHLMFTQIGVELPDRIMFSIDETYRIQKFIAERAYREIFANKRLPNISRFRTRRIDLDQFSYEEQQWENWHREQSAVEK